jgi:hypothetical protein
MKAQRRAKLVAMYEKFEHGEKLEACQRAWARDLPVIEWLDTFEGAWWSLGVACRYLAQSLVDAWRRVRAAWEEAKTREFSMMDDEPDTLLGFEPRGLRCDFPGCVETRTHAHYGRSADEVGLTGEEER